MTEAEQIKALKAMVGSEPDEVLSTYLQIAKNKVLNHLYPYDDTQTIIPARYDTNVLEIAAYLLNKRGAEGEISHNENGINRSYENADVPISMLRAITPRVGIIK